MGKEDEMRQQSNQILGENTKDEGRMYYYLQSDNLKREWNCRHQREVVERSGQKIKENSKRDRRITREVLGD